MTKRKREAKLKKLAKVLGPLDEKGFVFLHQNKHPCWCMSREGVPSLFAWDFTRRIWTFLHEITMREVWALPRNMPKKEQQKLHTAHEETISKMRGTKARGGGTV